MDNITENQTVSKIEHLQAQIDDLHLRSLEVESMLELSILGLYKNMGDSSCQHELNCLEVAKQQVEDKITKPLYDLQNLNKDILN
jgi:hypothetical protein